MKLKNIIYIIICLIIVAGIVVWKTVGFNMELQYSSRKQIELTNKTGIEISDIKKMVSEVLGNTRFIVQPVETFGNAVSIVAEDMTEEQKNSIVEKFNEKYYSEDSSEESKESSDKSSDKKIDNDDIKIVSIPFTRVKDVIKPYILPGIITLVLVTMYFTIRFRRLGYKKIFAKTLIVPVVAETLMFSIIAITRIPFGRVAITLGIALYLMTIFVLTNKFENERIKILEELENNN